jgi:hypothetical protein
MTVNSNVMIVRNQHQVSKPHLEDNDGASQCFVLVERQDFYVSMK